MLLMNEKALRQRCNKQYDDMMRRARPRLWKSGQRKGHVRVPGLQALPFTKDQLWALALEQIGENVVKCPYCVEIGRGANLIDLSNFVWDHIEPVARIGMAAHSLENLKAVCSDCNNLKGKFSLDFFIGFMAAIERWEDVLDRTSIYACMRTHGITLQGFRTKAKPTGDASAQPPTIQQLPLEEPW